ncbi:XRE family transcriptional regulator [Emticicia fluvialis]|uniref:XRE family transcriptional regulator n=1 Tax=Emticicia fluvialis TaxID=2974474 RepID=UPI00216518CF|nr:LexA family transcriptional regulator [Emticicia fluvialis]
MENQLVSQIKIARNIKLMRLSKGLTQEQLADALAIPSTRYANYEQGTRAIPIDTLVAISSYFHLALDALVKSDLSKVDLKGLMHVGENRLLFPILIKDDGKFESIEVVPVKASAGYLSGYADPEFIETLPKAALPFIGNGTHRGFPLTGDSMLPIPDESIIIGRFIERMSDVKDGRTYVVVATSGIAYKRVYIKKQEGVLLMVSDNKMYSPYEIPLESILELWEFKCYISTKEYAPDEYSLNNLFQQMSGLTRGIEEIKQRLGGKP